MFLSDLRRQRAALGAAPEAVPVRSQFGTLAGLRGAWDKVHALHSEAQHLLAAAPRLDTLGHEQHARAARERAQSALSELSALKGAAVVPEVVQSLHPRKCRPLVRKGEGPAPFAPVACASRALVGVNQEVLTHIFHTSVQLQRDEVQKVRGARRLFALMSQCQVEKVLGAQPGG